MPSRKRKKKTTLGISYSASYRLRVLNKSKYITAYIYVTNLYETKPEVPTGYINWRMAVFAAVGQADLVPLVLQQQRTCPYLH